ncbi:OmpH family outer membrane protein [Candidatus Pelagibacter communis]|uniref:OmpH family outer membrane protein n=1 Tax=Pelagibacter ubique TaxID=198252 RepID=UPI00094D7037|nr:OmpH family outer membrane protein [Candidatus Pelagibacter ubique]
MKFIFFIILTIFNFKIVSANEKIAFIDLNYIINNSLAGTSINNFINDLSKKKNKDFKLIENGIKRDESELISKKNIIDESIYNKKVNEIKIRIEDYKLERQKFNKTLNEKKIKYNNFLLEKLNPIISNYVENNLITIVLPKKMIIIGKKDLDITNQILEILNKSVQKINFNE